MGWMRLGVACVQLIQSDTSAVLPSSLLITGSKFTPAFKSRVLARIKTLERVHLRNQPMATDSPQFKAALHSLVKFEVTSRTQALARLVSRFNFLEALLKKVAGRRLETRKLIMGKKTLHTQIKAAYEIILAWIDYPSAQDLGHEYSFSTQYRQTWTLADVYQHRFPWQRDSLDAAAGGRKALITSYALRYRRMLQEYQRAVEEETLVEQEKRWTIQLYETQLRALSTRVLTIQQDIISVDRSVGDAQCSYSRLLGVVRHIIFPHLL